MLILNRNCIPNSTALKHKTPKPSVVAIIFIGASRFIDFQLTRLEVKAQRVEERRISREEIPREKKKLPTFSFPRQGKSSPLELLSREILSVIFAAVEKNATPRE